jgi:hypothetical protein
MKTTHQIVSTDEYIAEAQRLAIAQNKTFGAVWRRRAIELGSRGPQPLSPWMRTAWI